MHEGGEAFHSPTRFECFYNLRVTSKELQNFENINLLQNLQSNRRTPRGVERQRGLKIE